MILVESGVAPIIEATPQIESGGGDYPQNTWLSQVDKKYFGGFIIKSPTASVGAFGPGLSSPAVPLCGSRN